MITIDRTMSSAPLRDIEALPVLLFEGERYAHKFVVHPAPGITFAGMAVTARFITADETEEEIVAPGGQVVDGAAVVTLTPACYTVPGHFKFFIYVTDANRTVCVYACTGVVIPTVGANGTAGTSAGVIIEAYTAGAPLLDSLIPGKTAAFNDSNSVADQNFSVAIGYGLRANGLYSQAFGYGNEATKTAAHAEGRNTQAAGAYSHSEGEGTIASGNRSHAEGRETVASGENSHVEGQNTTANQQNQHVFGKYNIPDEDPGHYVEIVGNGKSYKASNARTLDWNGNEALAGSLTLGLGTSYETVLHPSGLNNLSILLSALGLNRVNLTVPQAVDRLVNMLEKWNGGAFGDGSGDFGSDHGAAPSTGLLDFIKQPKSRERAVGALNVFEIDIENANSYQWQYSADGGTTWIDCDKPTFTGAKTTRIVFQVAAEMNGWKFRCYVVAFQGTVAGYSDIATLTVTSA